MLFFNLYFICTNYIMSLFLHFVLILISFASTLKSEVSYEVMNNKDLIYKAVNPKSSDIEIAITGTFDEVQKYF